MERLALIELLDHDGRVLHVVAVTHWPVTIGRALDCDVILHDPHVAARHATLDELTLTAGETVNGVRLERGSLAAGESARLAPGAIWHMGRSALRVRLAGEALAAEQPLARPGARRRAWLTGGVCAVVMLWVWALLWLQNDPGSHWDKYVPTLLAVVFGAVAWCALWGLGSRLFRHRFSFAPHLRVLAVFALINFVLDGLLAVAAFSLSWAWLSHIRPWVGSALIAGLLASHFSLLLPGHARAISLVMAVLCVLGIGVDTALTWRHSERIFGELYAYTLPPPMLRLVAAGPASELIDALRPLKAELDRHAQEDEDKEGTEQ